MRISKKKALHWLFKAAENGLKAAQLNTALSFCIKEFGREQYSFVRSIYWFVQCLKNNKDENLCIKARGELDNLVKIQNEKCSSCEKKGLFVFHDLIFFQEKVVRKRLVYDNVSFDK